MFEFKAIITVSISNRFGIGLLEFGQNPLLLWNLYKIVGITVLTVIRLQRVQMILSVAYMLHMQTSMGVDA